MGLNFSNANPTDSPQVDFHLDRPYLSPKELHHFHLFSFLFIHTNFLLLNPNNGRLFKIGMHKNYGWGHSSQQLLIWQITQNHIFKMRYFLLSNSTFRKKRRVFNFQHHVPFVHQHLPPPPKFIIQRLNQACISKNYEKHQTTLIKLVILRPLQSKCTPHSF